MGFLLRGVGCGSAAFLSGLGGVWRLLLTCWWGAGVFGEVLCAGYVAGVDFVGGSVVTYSMMWLSLSVLGE